MKKFILFFALLIASMTFSVSSTQAASAPLASVVAAATVNPVKKTAPTKTEAQIEQARAEKVMKALGIKTAGSGKSQIIAVILCFFLGYLGVHRFYLGYIWQGVVQLLTLGGFGIWVLIDLIRIFMGSLKPNGGDYDTKF